MVPVSRKNVPDIIKIIEMICIYRTPFVRKYLERVKVAIKFISA